MSIAITCRCKTRLQVEEDMAGRLVKCPKCGENLMVPRPEPASAASSGEDDEYSLAPVPELPAQKPSCPACSAELPAGAVLCVQCGYHLVLKKHLGAE